MMIEFDEDFAGITDYAEIYRKIGLQVVPSIYPSRNAINWKRPALSNWREYQNELVDEDKFQEFMRGHDANRINIGILTGACSSRVFVVDLDLHKGGDCAVWWSCCLDMQETADELETPTQVTGGGGLQMLFRAPENWTPPTIKTSIGVDIRGAGGFAVIAPSMHESGKRYKWEEGKEPWNLEIADAPQWLCDQIDELAQRYGGHTPAAAGGAKTPTPDHVSDGYGHLIDGREDFMSRMIWARVVDLYRDSPIMDAALSERERAALFELYLTKVDTRLSSPGIPKADALEREGRGATSFAAKWANAIKQWDGKVARHAAEREKKPDPRAQQSVQEAVSSLDEEFAAAPASSAPAKEKSSDEIEILTLAEIMALPDPVWLVEDLFIEDATVFLYGPPGCGKSFLSLDLAMALASTHVDQWMGRKVNRHGPVVYITNEGVASLKFRLRAIEGKYGMKHTEAPFFLIRQPINLINAKNVLSIIQQIRHSVVLPHGAPVAIFIDTLSRAIPGVDENLQKDATGVIGAISAIKSVFGCMAMAVHHQSRAGGSDMRGSTAFDGAGDSNIQVEREKGETIGQIHARKIKDAEDGWSQDFELRKVELGFGKSSLVVMKPAEGMIPHGDEKNAPAANIGPFGGRQETGQQPTMEVCKQIVAFIGAEARDGVALSKERQTRGDGRYAPDVVSRRFGVEPEWVEKMIWQWLENGVLKNEILDARTKKKGLVIARGL